MTNEHNTLAQHQAEGLYEPSTERAACGVGFVVQMQGKKSHDIIRKGIEILVNLTHRGGCGCDPRTGDGAGILTQIPHEFFAEECAELGITLPSPGEYGVGNLFLPRLANEGSFCQNRLVTIIREEGQEFLGWRTPPIERTSLGWIAQDAEPYLKQVFIGRGKETAPDMFEWKLYVIRKRIEVEIRNSRLLQKSYFYMPSLSTRTIVYKGLMLPDAVDGFYPDLKNEKYTSALALVHQRFSTNTFPSWDLAQPFRYLAHNGEINTLRGNVNWMRARESMFASEKYGADLKKLGPICTPNASDTAIFDNTLELLVVTGRSLAQAMTMMIPEPWDHHETMSEEKKAYYEYQACLMEPWDGPACIAFTDGVSMGACLDRNGLRPSRYWVMKDGLVVMASEAGVLQLPQSEVVHKGRLQPGRMFLVDTTQGRIVADDEIKHSIASQKPYREWLKNNQKMLAHVMEKYNAAKEKGANGHAGNGHSEKNGSAAYNGFSDSDLTRLQRTFGYTLEDLRILIQPMAEAGAEAIGSMGTDTPLAVLSERPQILYSYFKQLFAQVTNPPLDAIREEVVTSLVVTLGSEGNLLQESPEQARLLRIEQPVLLDKELAAIKSLDEPGFKSRTLSMLYSKAGGKNALKQRLDELKVEASKAVEDGVTILILSDRGVSDALIPVPALLATGCVHHHLTREGTRSHCGLIIETGEPREVHHFALLMGFGAGAINPYLAFATIKQLVAEGIVSPEKANEKAKLPAEKIPELLDKNYAKAASKGVLKVMSKMGISTLQSYRGSQIFEAVGIDKSVIDEYFQNTPSRIQGIGLETIALESELRHSHGWPTKDIPQVLDLDVGGHYAWRRKGEYHLHNPDVVAKLQLATKVNSVAEFKKYCQLIDEQESHLCTLRGLLKFKFGTERVPLAEVESAVDIVKRFATGAMSFGSISKEAHETLAIAMNRIGAKSNTGEGGEDSARFLPDENGDRRRSAIKQVASGRFGVTSEYLVNSDELQIKMAQGAKPGEGGQLPGAKVDEVIGKVRHSTPGVGLISPPPHHDIYSIEDLAQLIHDLKNANHHARVSVKLVAEVGVGTVAAGVAKGKADVVLVSGFDGGTGASPQTSIKHAGLPWELGVAETHQVLLRNDLRSRVVVQTDGQIRTPKDVVVATLLGAEEWGVATASLVVSGCIMMRKCHLNTCPVGIATQDPELRKKFAGKPEYVVNFFFMLAEGVREIMADLGVRTINELVGRVDLLEIRQAADHWKARGLDLSTLLFKPRVNDTYGAFCSRQQDHEIDKSLDMTTLLDLCAPAIEHKKPVKVELPIKNINRTVGTILSSEITRKHGGKGLPEDTIQIHFRGTAGQSCLAFGSPGVTFRFEGDVNDYCGKGLSGGKIIVFPDRESTLVAEDNIICGNVALYGATAGQLYVRGVAGERFCVRNSGADAVVEGVGDHGCEYMTGGNVVVLGRTGRNFAAGMSGGVAYVYDIDGRFKNLVNMEMVAFEDLDAEDLDKLKGLISKHIEYTGSTRGKMILDDWTASQAKFVKIMPKDYRLALDKKKREMGTPDLALAGTLK